MIFKIEIENFYSIKGPLVIDLIAGMSFEHERLSQIGPQLSERVPKVVAILGANAAGKSNVLRVLSFLAWFVGHSFNIPPNHFLPVSKFSSEETAASPMRLRVHFAGPDDVSNLATSNETVQASKYMYELVLGGNSLKPEFVISELLRYWPAETKRPVNLIERFEDGSIKANKEFALKGFQSSLEKILRKNVSVISTLAQLKHPISTALWNAASSLHTNIFIEKAEFDEDSVTQMYQQNPDLLEALNREIERIDFGIQKLELIELSNSVVATLKHDGLAAPLLLHSESHGTRQFIKIFPLLFYALVTGGVAVIDELDSSIHPLILPEIVGWFHRIEKNPLGAQLWITVQNPSILEILTKDEIFFCEKNRQGETNVYGLKDIHAVRRTDNFYRKYLGGVYGAIPKLG